MTISLGKTPDDPRVIRKTFNTVASFSGSLKNDSSIITPTVRIAGNVGSVAGCNYMHIPEFGRYYFITNIVSIANNLYEVSGKVDVLKSNADDILASKALAYRSSGNYDLYLDDSNFKLHANPNIRTTSFPSGFDFTNSSFLLFAAG